MYKTALKSMLSELLRQKRIVVIENLKFTEPKTKMAKELLTKLGLSSALFVATELDKNTILSLRNLPSVQLIAVSGLNPLSMIKYDNLVLTCDAVKKIEDMLL